MFSYKDPGGTLKPAGALASYRQLLHAQYRMHAKLPRSAFTFLEAFEELAAGKAAQQDAVEWSAFPITATASNEEIDNDRFRHQDEYVEWRVAEAAGRITEITFTTEFLEYYQALAMAGMTALAAGIKVVVGVAPEASELFGEGFDPQSSTAEGRSQRFAAFARRNPWNNGTKGILCLAHPLNTLGALFNLVGRGAVENQTVPAGAICGTLGDFCGSGRNSDPSIASAVQSLSRAKRGLSFVDPVGIQIVRLGGIWALNGKQFDINDSDLFAVTRTGRRGVLKNAAGLTVDDEPIATGAQVASRLRVHARVVSAAESDLPEWSRVGQEDSTRLDQVAA